MKNIFKPGDKKQTRYRVQETDVASFLGEVVHPVCATYTLAMEIEWATRQFVLEMSEEDEDGIGTSLTIDHRSPAFVGDEIVFTACRRPRLIIAGVAAKNRNPALNSRNSRFQNEWISAT